MNKQGKQIIFATLTACLIGVSEHCVTSRVQASQLVSQQAISLQATQSSPSSQPIAILTAQLTSSSSPPQPVIEWIKQNPSVGGFVVAVILYLGVLGLRPIWLLLLPLDKIPKIGRIPEIPIPAAIGSFLKYRPRVLDAWVSQRILQAQEEFNQRRTVGERSIHIPIPVELDGKKPAVANFSADDLKAVFSKRFTRLVIVGEGGVGKTSLACQIAKWAMAENKTERLYEHRMLPVLIEEELEPIEGKSSLLEAIALQIKSLRDDEKPVSEELLKQLLEKRRILVIVDHLSEMSEATQKATRLRDASSPVNALIVTSRTEGILGREVTYTVLKPMRVEGKQLFNFVYDYITQQGKRNLFNQVDLFDASSRLSRIVTDKQDITVLFAKLYADQMIAVAEGLVTEDLPNNVPDLMLSYINEVNQEKDGKLDDDIVQRDLKVIAWECLKQTFKPETAEREEVIDCLAALEREGNTAKESAQKRLKYLEERLALIRTVPPAKTKIRFALDPLAEYLASLHLVNLYGENEQAWRSFLEEARNKQGTLDEIQGLLLAIRDCYTTRTSEIEVSNFVLDELGKLANLDLEFLKKEQLRKKIQLLTVDLKVIEDEERIAHATQRIGYLFDEIDNRNFDILILFEKTVPALIKLFKFENNQIWLSAQSTLVKLGSLAVPHLANSLKDTNVKIRQCSSYTLRQIGIDAQTAIPILIEVLDDKDAEVRYQSIITLSKLGNLAKDAIPALINALKDKEAGVRAYAAFALGKIGSEAQGAIPFLIEALKDDNGNVFIATAEAMEAIGFNLSEIEGEAQLDEIKGEVGEVITTWRKNEYIKKSAKRNLGGVLLEHNSNLSPYTPPQKDIYNTGADKPKWL